MTDRKKAFLGVGGLVLLGILAVWAILPAGLKGLSGRFVPGIRLGLDLRGGTQLTYAADLTGVPVEQRTDALEGVRDVLEQRINAFGVAEPVVQVIRGGTPRVILELAGVQDVDAAIRQIGETPQLDFREPAAPDASPSPSPIVGEQGAATAAVGVEEEIRWVRTELTGKHLKRADVLFDPNTGEPQISLLFDGEGKRLFADLTKKHVGRPIGIFLDGVPITAPVVQQAITTGEAIITGQFTIDEAKQLARRLNAGALPVPIRLESRTTIGPTLGQESLAQSLVAGVVGLVGLTVIMIALYRLPGMVAVCALLLYALLTLAALAIFGTTLTVAGIAGIILSLGMAVVANILIFERTKEELRAGKPLRTSLQEGFREAWPSIRDSNVASLITAGLLYAFGSSVVRGFATTLGIGILLSMFSAVTVTRTLLRAAAQVRRLQHPRWYVRLHSPTGARAWGLFTSPRWIILSLLLVVASVTALAAWGLRPGIDFTGGSLIELTGGDVPAVRAALAAAGQPGAVVQATGSGSILVRLGPLSTEDHATLVSSLIRHHPSLVEVRFETVGPTIGRELLRKATMAVVLAVLLILGYLAWAFRKATMAVSSWAFGVIAVVALVHDLLVMSGAFSLFARFRGASADSLFLTAALTLLGFSVHDTIVVFNRLKSNLLRLRLDFRDLVQRSVLETLTRSLNTSATTLFVLLALLFFGASTTRPFVATLSVGIVVGTYSSIFLAVPLLVLWEARKHRRHDS